MHTPKGTHPKTPFLSCTVICVILDHKSKPGSSQRSAPYANATDCWKSLLPSYLCMSQTILSCIKVAWNSGKFFYKKAFWTHPLIPSNSTNSMAMSKIKGFFSQIMCRVIYITYGNFKSFHIICPQIFETKAFSTTLNQPMIWNPKLKEINSTANMLAKILTYVSQFFHCV